MEYDEDAILKPPSIDLFYFIVMYMPFAVPLTRSTRVRLGIASHLI